MAAPVNLKGLNGAALTAPDGSVFVSEVGLGTAQSPGKPVRGCTAWDQEEAPTHGARHQNRDYRAPRRSVKGLQLGDL